MNMETENIGWYFLILVLIVTNFLVILRTYANLIHFKSEYKKLNYWIENILIIYFFGTEILIGPIIWHRIQNPIF
tara:strand:+ start:1120 stop:1344 length:225 start_codon:yes stop_codon:yes gene_type:complete